ncbi:uncharacterized protein LOC120352226 [Nilaparvata lugens]|uniref:uncharacterized protein LOC120352226 n=1 Tax=Nilaparvata lugens TaxID=108931 RepID=UPI00193D2BDE|nr:uncharacterized protein LOC120352226 [Nilaparvata lugens]
MNPMENLDRSEARLLQWYDVSPSHIVKMVNGFRNSQSQDIYGMTIIVLKSIIDVIAAPLSCAINECLHAGVFPQLLKMARTVPVYKKGDPTLIDSFRPISIVPVFAKVFETVMKEQIVVFFESNRLFSDLQHGFRRNKSTLTAVTE